MSIHKENVQKINAKIVIEVANGALTHWADEYLNKEGTTVIPDVIAGLGGMISCYFEFLNNIDKRDSSELIKKWEEKSKSAMMSELEAILDKTHLNGAESLLDIRERYLKGPNEDDLLYGFLEDSSVKALKQALNTADKENVSIRVAAYMNGLRRISHMYDHWETTN